MRETIFALRIRNDSVSHFSLLISYLLIIPYNLSSSALLMYNGQWACCRTRRGGWFTLQHEPIYVAALQPGILSRCQSAALVKRQIVLRDVSFDGIVMDYGLRGNIVRASELMRAAISGYLSEWHIWIIITRIPPSRISELVPFVAGTATKKRATSWFWSEL